MKINSKMQTVARKRSQLSACSLWKGESQPADGCALQLTASSDHTLKFKSLVELPDMAESCQLAT